MSAETDRTLSQEQAAAIRARSVGMFSEVQLLAIERDGLQFVLDVISGLCDERGSGFPYVPVGELREAVALADRFKVNPVSS